MLKEQVDIVLEFIRTVGFPIAVAVYLLWKYDQKMSKIYSLLEKIISFLEQTLKTQSSQSENQTDMIKESLDLIKEIKLTLSLKLK